MRESASGAIEDVFKLVEANLLNLVPGEPLYLKLKADAQRVFQESRFSTAGDGNIPGFGELKFPFRMMGAVSSIDLFGLDELILFTFYRLSRGRYRSFADLGANIGLHSILANKLGWKVSAYEPDPETSKIASENFAANGSTVSLITSAVAVASGTQQFTRVEGNLTGSHLTGRKENVFGTSKVFHVNTVPFGKILSDNDLLKIDVEGSEAELLCSTRENDWSSTDAVMEIGSSASAGMIFEHIRDWEDTCLFSQKTGWRRVRRAADLPEHHTQGSVYVSSRPSEILSRR